MHEQVYAIGDAENDIDMLRATKHGYTFHHSPATVKQYAEGCVKSVSELIDKILKRTNWNLYSVFLIHLQTLIKYCVLSAVYYVFGDIYVFWLRKLHKLENVDKVWYNLINKNEMSTP